MPSPSVDSSYWIRKHEEKSHKKSGFSRNKMLAVLLEHTRSYIPLKKSSTKAEFRRVIACNRRYAEVGNRKNYSGDAFLEPYMQGLSNDVSHANVDEVLNDSCTALKKRLLDDYPVNEDRASSFSSPVNNLDTPLDEKIESHFRLIEVHTESHGSLTQLISGDECSETASENSSLVGDEETLCDITLLERLIRSHPIWFLPSILRAGAFHLLQGKEDGNFVVRQSSQNSTMAISVRLPNGKGPYIEHYLIQGYEDGQIGLESSDNKFSSIPLLIAHYCQCCDELPVQLTLPRAIREAKNRQQLSSLALLGQEFWRYPMANPRSSLKVENESPTSLMSVPAHENNAPITNSSFLNSSSSNSPASSLSSFESSNNNITGSSGALELSPTAFDIDSCPPLEESSLQSSNLMITFKGSPSFSSVPYNQIGIPVTFESPSSLPVETSQSQIIGIRRPRPTPPNTLNLTSTTTSAITKTLDNRSDNSSPSLNLLTSPTNKTPPPPPPRWTKPSVTSSSAQNFTVTTTLTFTVNKEKSPPPDVTLSGFQISSATERVERHVTTNEQVIHSSTLTASLPTIPPTPLPRSFIPPMTSPSSQILSPVSEGNTRRFHRRPRRLKDSHHYQESDIIESYHRSTFADKASDYEDIWGPDCNLTTFKPQPPPRCLPFTPTEDLSSTITTIKTTSPSSSICDVAEQTTVASPTTPASETKNLNKNRFGLFLNTSGGEPSATVNESNAVPVATTPVELQTKVPNVGTPSEPKLGSPFYAEPADAIKQAVLKRRMKPNSCVPSNRHSDPVAGHQWQPVIAGTGVLERINSKEELITNSTFSSSVDNLVALRNSRQKSNGPTCVTMKNVKPIEPPKVTVKPKYCGDIWAVDTNWEYRAKEVTTGNIDDVTKANTSKNAIEDQNPINEEQFKGGNDSINKKTLTVQDMIFQRSPELRLSPTFKIIVSTTDKGEKSSGSLDESPSSNACSNGLNDSNNNSNNSEKIIYRNGLSVLSQISDTSDDTQTEFSEPWDSSQWEHLLNKSSEEVAEENHASVNRCRSFKERLDPLLSPPRLKALAKTRETNMTPGVTVRAYALKLASDKDTVFAKAIDNFISCTIESRETKPQVVMRNMRQFMSGMKNYLVTHGEREFIKEVESERNKLKATEFLNLDAILEGVMHKLVISPLKHHLYQLFVQEYEQNGALKLLVENIRHARTKSPADLGVKERMVLPSEEDLETISILFLHLQQSDSPLEKLEFLLKAISLIFHSIKENNHGPESIFIGADDFLPIFVWVLVRTGMVAAEIEAEYMWGLLHPSLLSGEGGYYLTTLSSAVNVLKNFRPCNSSNSVSPVPWSLDPLAEFKCVLKVVVPNELNGSLLTKTLPVRPNMTTKDICKIIALKIRITNPQDFSLYKLVDGEETLLNDNECPQDVKSELAKVGKHCLFAYKRIDAKIAWPKNTTPCN